MKDFLWIFNFYGFLKIFNIYFIWRWNIWFATVSADYDNDGRISTSPIGGNQEETRSSLSMSQRASPGFLMTPTGQEGDQRGIESERSSPSPVEDEATTSRLELFQISALADSYEADPMRNLSANESPIVDSRCG